MYTFSVGEKEYKVRFGYGVLCKTNVLDNMMLGNADGEKSMVRNTIQLVAELLLTGLQKYHSNEFGFDTEKEKESAFEKVYDLLDEYEDTNDNGKTVFNLFEDLEEELMKNGFLSGMIERAEKVKKKK